MSEKLDAHLALLQALAAQRYRFITPTPATHARVIARKDVARDLRDVFGWSLPFERDMLDDAILATLKEADALETDGNRFRSRLRVSSLDDMLFLHSAFPTTKKDSVFFGPDSYRFASFIRAEVTHLGKRPRIADIGAGTGVGAIVARQALLGRSDEDAVETTTVFNDINPKALELASANAMMASVPGSSLFDPSDSIAKVETTFDLILANPPYIADPLRRSYRDGGGMHGAELSLAWAEAAAGKLVRDGVLLFYTGSAIVDGVDRFKGKVEKALRAQACDITYSELDPDVFGEELEREDYADVERIAVVGVVAVKR